MRKSSKTKSSKVPKLTETQYAEYVEKLKGEDKTPKQNEGNQTEKPCS